MVNAYSIARPYAVAAFESARDQQQLAAWKKFLKLAVYMANQPEVVKLLNGYDVSYEKIASLFLEVLDQYVDALQKNFLLLLAKNKRLNLLKEVVELFDRYCADFEKMKTARVVTAVEMTEDYRRKLTSLLTKRVQQEVVLQTEIDPAIIAGAVIYMGDSVIDASVRGKLARLFESLSR
ncbi:MAG TPA: F0F1 ATP synthase subunit delta [Gammaproteobacteria bacterium]|jgi:F-type H+-transporting ATPase subunit delta|nr:F0F1 ATP synthase subunit delta [Gammaproteobacteria bacterium]